MSPAFIGMVEQAHTCTHEHDEESHLCWCAADMDHGEREYGA